MNVTVVTVNGVEVVEHGTEQIGNSQFYGRGGFPTVTVVSVAGETFLRNTKGEYLSTCGRCDEGRMGQRGTIVMYGNVFGGVCFECHGRGYRKNVGTIEAVTKVVKRRISDRARRERKAAEKESAAKAAVAAWTAAHPAVAEKLAAIRLEAFGTPSEGGYQEPTQADYDAQTAAYDKWTGFVVDLASKAAWHALSDKQTEAVTAAIGEAEAAQAAKDAKQNASRYFEGDKVAKATGTVVTAIRVESRFGISMLVVVEGTGDYAGITFKMFGTGATLWETERGQSVLVSGSVKDREVYEGVKQTVLTRTKVEQA